MSFYVMPFINKFVLVRRGECWRNICKVYLRDKSCYKVNDVATYVITRHSRVVAYITDKQYYQQTQERKGIFSSYTWCNICKANLRNKFCYKVNDVYRTLHFSTLSWSGNSQKFYLKDYNTLCILSNVYALPWASLKTFLWNVWPSVSTIKVLNHEW